MSIISDLFRSICIFLGRFVVDAIIVIYLIHQYDIYKTQERIPLNDGETMRKFEQRRYVLKLIETSVWNQEKWFEGGEECKQWFLKHIEELPVQELEGWMLLVEKNHLIQNLTEGNTRWREKWLGPTQETSIL